MLLAGEGVSQNLPGTGWQTVWFGAGQGTSSPAGSKGIHRQGNTIAMLSTRGTIASRMMRILFGGQGQLSEDDPLSGCWDEPGMLRKSLMCLWPFSWNPGSLFFRLPRTGVIGFMEIGKPLLWLIFKTYMSMGVGSKPFSLILCMT